MDEQLSQSVKTADATHIFLIKLWYSNSTIGGDNEMPSTKIVQFARIGVTLATCS